MSFMSIDLSCDEIVIPLQKLNKDIVESQDFKKYFPNTVAAFKRLRELLLNFHESSNESVYVTSIFELIFTCIPYLGENRVDCIELVIDQVISFVGHPQVSSLAEKLVGHLMRYPKLLNMVSSHVENAILNSSDPIRIRLLKSISSGGIDSESYLLRSIISTRESKNGSISIPRNGDSFIPSSLSEQMMLASTPDEESHVLEEMRNLYLELGAEQRIQIGSDLPSLLIKISGLLKSEHISVIINALKLLEALSIDHVTTFISISNFDLDDVLESIKTFAIDNRVAIRHYGLKIAAIFSHMLPISTAGFFVESITSCLPLSIVADNGLRIAMVFWISRFVKLDNDSGNGELAQQTLCHFQKIFSDLLFHIRARYSDRSKDKLIRIEASLSVVMDFLVVVCRTLCSSETLARCLFANESIDCQKEILGLFNLIAPYESATSIVIEIMSFAKISAAQFWEEVGSLKLKSLLQEHAILSLCRDLILRFSSLFKSTAQCRSQRNLLSALHGDDAIVSQLSSASTIVDSSGNSEAVSSTTNSEDSISLENNNESTNHKDEDKRILVGSVSDMHPPVREDSSSFVVSGASLSKSGREKLSELKRSKSNGGSNEIDDPELVGRKGENFSTTPSKNSLKKSDPLLKSKIRIINNNNNNTNSSNNNIKNSQNMDRSLIARNEVSESLNGNMNDQMLDSPLLLAKDMNNSNIQRSGDVTMTENMTPQKSLVVNLAKMSFEEFSVDTEEDSKDKERDKLVSLRKSGKIPSRRARSAFNSSSNLEQSEFQDIDSDRMIPSTSSGVRSSSIEIEDKNISEPMGFLHQDVELPKSTINSYFIESSDLDSYSSNFGSISPKNIDKERSLKPKISLEDRSNKAPSGMYSPKFSVHEPEIPSSSQLIQSPPSQSRKSGSHVSASLRRRQRLPSQSYHAEGVDGVASEGGVETMDSQDSIAPTSIVPTEASTATDVVVDVRSRNKSISLDSKDNHDESSEIGIALPNVNLPSVGHSYDSKLIKPKSFHGDLHSHLSKSESQQDRVRADSRDPSVSRSSNHLPATTITTEVNHYSMHGMKSPSKAASNHGTNERSKSIGKMSKRTALSVSTATEAVHEDSLSEEKHLIAHTEEITSNQEHDVKFDAMEYLSNENIFPSENPQRELNQVLTGMEKQDWGDIFRSLNSIRRLALHHKSLLTSSGNLHAIVMSVVKHIDNLRSSVAKNALLALGGLFQGLQRSMDAEVGNTSASVIKRLGDTSTNFLGEAAEVTLLEMIKCISPSKSLATLMLGIENKSPTVRGKIAKLLLYFVQDKRNELRNIKDITSLFAKLGKLTSDSSPDSRQYSRTVISYLIENDIYSRNELENHIASDVISKCLKDVAVSNNSLQNTPAKTSRSKSRTRSLSTSEENASSVPSSARKNRVASAVRAMECEPELVELSNQLQLVQSNDWNERMEGISKIFKAIETHGFVLKEAGKLEFYLDRLAEKLEDGNVKVVIHTLDHFEALMTCQEGLFASGPISLVLTQLANQLAATNKLVCSKSTTLLQNLLNTMPVYERGLFLCSLCCSERDKTKIFAFRQLSQLVSSFSSSSPSDPFTPNGFIRKSLFPVVYQSLLSSATKPDVRAASLETLRGIHSAVLNFGSVNVVPCYHWVDDRKTQEELRKLVLS